MNEETYQLTPLGCLSAKYGAEAKDIIETLMDYCKTTGDNAIVFNEFPGQFECVRICKRVG